jgi:cephalosporin-C deacetylase-like acetyl esterase
MKMTDLERLKAYDDELSKVMPPDFKDWWQNSKDEWPEIAAWVITNLRERLEESERQLDYAYEEMERRS